MDDDLLELVQLRRARMVKNVRYRAALVCYLYPRYKLSDVMDMPTADIDLLLNVAQAENISDKMTELAIAASAMDSKSYKKTYNHLSKQMKDTQGRI